MCGISGIVGVEPDRYIHAMLQTIEHRGRDDEGIWTSQAIDETGRRVCLGHRRLAIIDTSTAGHQPMLSADGRYAITFNGEIYNYRELREELKPRGYEFRTNTDTEVLLAAFAEWGADCLPRLNGMFAFAVWDHLERTLTLARDHVGIKPLYSAYLPGKNGHASSFIFGSEIKAMLATGLITVPFFGSRVARAANRPLLSAQIGALARRRGLTRPILWIAIPTAVEMIGRLDESLVVYQVSDKYDANTMDHATDPTLISHLHERALNAADIIFYSGRKLFAEAERGRERSYLLEQAVDFEHWSKVGSGEVEIAPQVAHVPRPRLGYFGAIEPWLVDQELIKCAGRERPSWHWVFIGNRSRGLEIENLPNVHFLDPVAYEELPRYAAGFDVCVLPWETERAFTNYGSAIKVREYLATGKPVVIAPLPEYEPMRDVLRIARSRDDFLRLIQDALDERGEEASRARQASVAGGTWDVRAEWVSDLIEKALVAKRMTGDK